MVCIFSDGPLTFHWSTKQLIGTEARDSFNEPGG